ncbi:MAG: T9SS type A sorting domain-containing protein [Crocinitomicaceae bacterium]|nr:T9SS type A sorting domain-containing protein [Crocinitomicaceae bacterium]
MKNYTLILLLLTGSFTQAQDDTTFANNSAYWNVKTWTYGIFDIEYGGYSCEMLNVTVDTLGHQWKSLVNGSSDLVGLVRIDAGKVIYQGINTIGFGLGHSHEGDTLVEMYDFNLEVGAAYPGYEPLYLDSITTTNFLGVPKRTFHWSDGTGGAEDTWIEGMGSVNGFFRPVMSSFELGFNLCLYDGEYTDSLDVDYSLNYDNPSTCETLSVNPIEHEIRFTKGPNWIQFETKESLPLSIYNLNGQLMYNEQLGSGVSFLELDFLNSGVYVVNVGNYFFEKVAIL